MILSPPVVRGVVRGALLVLAITTPLPAQELSFRAGPSFLSPTMLGAWIGWRPGSLGPFAAEVGAMSLGSSDGTRYGVTLDGLARLGPGPYLVAGLAGGFGAGSARGDWGSWSAGLGLTLLDFPVRLAFEGRYRVLTDPRETGIDLTGRISIPIGGGRSSRGQGSGPAPPTLPAPTSIPTPTSGSARTVVETALQAMGTPYVWGGTDANGFDCSGLIQYAYGRAGIALPRRSVDQARAGTPVVPRIERLEPGDILGFAESGREITHVGLYLGGGEFIHSSNRGVRRSRLAMDDPEGRWWAARWVSARRILSP